MYNKCFKPVIGAKLLRLKTCGLFPLLVLLLSLPLVSKAQDPNFSQFYYNPVYYNPAYVGIKSGINIHANYRKAWPHLDGDFTTYNFSLDSEEPMLYGGIGLMAMSGVEGNGTIRSSSANLSYAYRLIVIPRKFIVQMGMAAGIVQKKIDWSNMVFSDQLDPVHGDIYQTAFDYPAGDKVLYPDFSTGIVARFNVGKSKYNSPIMTNTVGFGFHHVTEPEQSFLGLESTLPMKMTAHFNSIIPLRGGKRAEVKLAPAFIYERQDMFETFTVGMNAMMSPVYAGLWMRRQSFSLNYGYMESLIFMVGINTKINTTDLKIGYSYDMTVSGLKTATAGSHEISVSMNFDNVRIFNKRNSMRRSARSNNKCFKNF